MAHTGYSFRPRAPQAAVSSTVPDGYTRLDEFNAGKNKYGKLSGIKGTGVDETGIWVKEYGNSVLLWWEKPLKQVDDFAYTGKSQSDIDFCDGEYGMKAGYTWHHTGYPA